MYTVRLCWILVENRKKLRGNEREAIRKKKRKDEGENERKGRREKSLKAHSLESLRELIKSETSCSSRWCIWTKQPE